MKYERLANIRNRVGISQRQIAKILKVSKSTYARWETGEIIIPLKHLINFCNYFNVSLDYVLGLSNKKDEIKKPIKLNNKIIGSKLKQFRLKNNLTQNDIAELLNTTHSVISAYENAVNTIQTSFLYAICKKYNISADELFDV